MKGIEKFPHLGHSRVEGELEARTSLNLENRRGITHAHWVQTVRLRGRRMSAPGARLCRRSTAMVRPARPREELRDGEYNMVRRHAAELMCITSSPGRWKTWSKSTSYTRFAGSVLEEYLYRSPKRAAEMINERMALAAERVVRGRGLRQSRPGNSVSETVSQY